MRRVTGIILSLLLCLSIMHTVPPAEAAFVDVPTQSWFEAGIDTCAEQGVMVGTGGDRFSPEKTLSQAECLTLAFRLYDLMQGNEHVIEKAPEDWGKLTLTLADGTVLEGYGYQGQGETKIFSWWSWKNDYEGACAQVPGYLEGGARAQQKWMDAHEDICGTNAPATLTLNGVTYQGTANCWMPVGPFVFQFEPEYEKTAEVNAILHHAVFREAGPDRWWRDTSYTITQRGLEDIFDPVEFSDAPASRSFFAQLIADACQGHLEKINTIGDIPDLPREFPGPGTYPQAELYRDAVYALYEAGILTGTDSAGTFSADATLTRAEAAVMVARALDESQRVSWSAYARALAEQRGHFGYYNERLFDTDICTVVVNDYGGMMQASEGVITVIYKPDSARGDGVTLRLPHAGNDYSTLISRDPDCMELSDDGTTFTYSYYFTEPLEGDGEILRPAGNYTYTVDLATGEVTSQEEPLSFDNTLETLEYAVGYRVENVKDGGETVALLRSRAYQGDEALRDYELYLVRRGGEPYAQRLVLPSTQVLADGYAPTTREPDSLEFHSDGTSLVYTYRFLDELRTKDSLLHEAKTYVYTVDVATGELTVQAEEPYAYALAQFTQPAENFPFQLEQQLEAPACTVVVGMSKALTYPRAILALVYKPGSYMGAGEVIYLPLKVGETVYGAIPPDSITLNEEKTVLTYVYQFDEDQYAVDKTLFSRLTYQAGTYTTTVELRTGTVNETFTPKE